jgi:hypothetical protein
VMAERSAYVFGSSLPGADGTGSAALHAFASSVDVGKVAVFWNPGGSAEDAQSILIDAEAAAEFVRELSAVVREARKRGSGRIQ